MEDPTARARALVGLARYLWQEGARRLQSQTLEAAQEIETEAARAKALAGLAPYLSLPLLAKALATARAIAGNGARARALGRAGEASA